MAEVYHLNTDVESEYVPPELKRIEQWVLWRPVKRSGKITKPPYRPDTPSKLASVTNPAHWAPYSAAVNAAGPRDGVGFVLTEEDPVAGFDLDKCIADGIVEEWAVRIVEEMDTYTEVSPSGAGLRLFFFGHPPNGRKGTFECYHSNRYLTVTGNTYHDKPRPVQQRGKQAAKIVDRFSIQEAASADTNDTDITPITLPPSKLRRLETKARKLYEGGLGAINEEIGDGSASDADYYLACALTRAFPNIDKTNVIAAILGSELRREKTHHLASCAERALKERFDETVGLFGIEEEDALPYDPWDDDEEAAEWLSLHSLLSEELPDVPWVIENVLPAGGLCSLFGEPGAGKSFIALDWALRIAHGFPDWMGAAIVDGAAFYIAGEGRHSFRSRLDSWAEDMDPEAPWYILLRQAAFSEKGEADRIADSISKLHKPDEVRLLVIDTLAQNFGPGNENSTEDMAAFLHGCRVLTEAFPEACVLIVHHTGHFEQQRARGSSSLKGALDAEFRAGKGKLECTKQRNRETEGLWGFRIEQTGTLTWTGHIAQDGENRPVGQDGAIRARILQSFIDYEQLTRSERMAHIQYKSNSRFDKYCMDFMEMGILEKSKNGRWILSDKARAEEVLAEYIFVDEEEDIDPLS